MTCRRWILLWVAWALVVGFLIGAEIGRSLAE